MRVHFDPAFDTGAWPGPLSTRVAVAGEAWVGPAGLLGLLETDLGLGGRWPGATERAAALVPALAAQEGFWSRSLEADALGTSRFLLAQRDRLVESGWEGESGGQRLEALGAVTAEVLPGEPDRLRCVCAALERQGLDWEEVVLYEEPEALSWFWQQVLEALGACGVSVRLTAPAPAEAKGDLLAAQKTGFVPAGDGSLFLLRAPGPLACAEEVAAWLAAQDSLEGTLILGAHAVLDSALRRHGLPVTGAPCPEERDTLLQLLPLVLALGEAPPDPRRALEFLSLPEAPLPRRLRRNLRRALQQWPAVGSPDWDLALREGLDAIEDAQQRLRATERAGWLFGTRAAAGSGSYPLAEARARAKALGDWLRSRARAAAADEGPWLRAASQCAAFGTCLEFFAGEELSTVQVRLLVEGVSAEAGAAVPYPAEAGFAQVREPGALVGPVRRIVWWGFEASHALTEADTWLSPAERRALAAAGVELTDPGDALIRAARRWTRPLSQASESLLLVCPEIGLDGEEVHPHPLWDEIAARLGGEASLSLLVGAQVPGGVSPASSLRELQPLPRAQRDFELANPSFELREQESPSSLGTFLGCPFRWVLQYPAGLRGGDTAALPGAGDARLTGSLAHDLLARVLGSKLSAENARREAERLFDEEAPRLATLLFFPEANAQRAKVRHTIAEAAADLSARLRKAKARVHSIEEPAEVEAFGTKLRGTPDLVLAEPRAVIDLKWGSAKFRSKELEEGRAYQLACYAHLVQGELAGKGPVAVGYYILSTQQLLTSEPEGLLGGSEIPGASPAQTYASLVEAHAGESAALREGRVVASGNGEPDPDQEPRPGLQLEPPCRYCDYGLLCGRDLGGEL